MNEDNKKEILQKKTIDLALKLVFTLSPEDRIHLTENECSQENVDKLEGLLVNVNKDLSIIYDKCYKKTFDK